MNGTVFCPIFDPARAAAPALELAADLAERRRAPLSVVSITAPIPPLGAAPGVAPPMSMTAADVRAAGPDRMSPAPEERAARAELGELLQDTGVQPAYADCVVGAPIDVVRELSELDDAAFVVAHDQGGGPIRSKLTGNPGREAIRAQGCPLVLAPDGTGGPLTPRPRILCAVDDDDMTASVLTCAGELARDLDASVHVLFSRRDDALAPIATEGMLVRSFDHLSGGVEASFMAVDEPAAESIERTAREVTADLVVLGRPHRGSLGAAVFGSVAHDVLERAPAPVVVVRETVEAAA